MLRVQMGSACNAYQMRRRMLRVAKLCEAEGPAGYVGRIIWG